MIEEITDYLERAKERLPEYYKELPSIDGILDIIEAEFQAAETTIQEFLNKRSLSTAEGEQLDRLAEYLLLTRDSDTDDAFRARLISRVSELIRAGQMQVLIDVYKGLTGSTKVYARNVYPLTVELLAEIDAPLADEQSVLAGITAVHAAGVQLSAQVTLPSYFLFLESEGGTARGFAADELSGAPLTRALS